MELVFRKFYAEKCVDLWKKCLIIQVFWAPSKRWSLGSFLCAGCTIITMNTSILPRILVPYGQNKHYFCQDRHVLFFSAICWQVFLYSTQFSSNFVQKKDTSSWKSLKLSNQALIETMENWILEVVSKLVSRPFSKRHVEHRELKNCSWTKTIVFIAVLEKKTSFKWSVSSLLLFMRIVNSCFITYMEQFFSFMQ